MSRNSCVFREVAPCAFSLWLAVCVRSTSEATQPRTSRDLGESPLVSSYKRGARLPGFWRGGGAVPASPQRWRPSLFMLPCQIPTPSSTKPGMRASSFGDHGEHSQEEHRAENGRKCQLTV